MKRYIQHPTFNDETGERTKTRMDERTQERKSGQMTRGASEEGMNVQRSTSNVQRSTDDDGPDAARRAPKDGDYDLGERLLEYAARILRLAEALPKTRAGHHIAGQLLRSGTSPLSNHAEAQGAESAADFIHKLRISLKELREAYRWLRLCKRVPLVKPPEKLDPLLAETDELIAIFVTSIKTVEESGGRNGTARK